MLQVHKLKDDLFETEIIIDHKVSTIFPNIASCIKHFEGEIKQISPSIKRINNLNSLYELENAKEKIENLNVFSIFQKKHLLKLVQKRIQDLST